MSDPRARQARRQHQRAGHLDAQADQARAARDDLIRQLRDDDPRRWTYQAIADAVGCSAELVAHIIRKGHSKRLLRTLRD